MAIGKGRLFVPKVIAAGKLGAALAAAATATGQPNLTQAKVQRQLSDGSTQEEQGPLGTLDSICDLAEAGLQVSAGWSPQEGAPHHVLVFGGRPGYAEARVTAPSAGAADLMLDAFMSVAGLDDYVEPPAKESGAVREPQSAAPVAPVVGGLESRVKALEGKAMGANNRRLRAFLSYRFASESGELLAARIQRFLTALDVETISGAGYEPRRVSDKVAERLGSGIDLLVLVVRAGGESLWTRDEIATARAQGIAVVPLVEDGAEFEPGIFGDLEYVTFAPDHIGDAFLALAEAIAWVRQAKAPI